MAEIQMQIVTLTGSTINEWCNNDTSLLHLKDMNYHMLKYDIMNYHILKYDIMNYHMLKYNIMNHHMLQLVKMVSRLEISSKFL